MSKKTEYDKIQQEVFGKEQKLLDRAETHLRQVKEDEDERKDKDSKINLTKYPAKKAVLQACINYLKARWAVAHDSKRDHFTSPTDLCNNSFQELGNVIKVNSDYNSSFALFKSETAEIVRAVIQLRFSKPVPDSINRRLQDKRDAKAMGLL